MLLTLVADKILCMKNGGTYFDFEIMNVNEGGIANYLVDPKCTPM